MKRLPKFLKIVLSFVLIITLSIAIIPVTATVEAEKKAERKVVLADYDTFDDVYNTFDVMSNLSFIGYYTQTTDTNKVMSGTGSLEMFIEGTVAETTDYGTLADEIRINTTNHWFGQSKRRNSAYRWCK